MITKYIVMSKRKGPNSNMPYRQESYEFDTKAEADIECAQLNSAGNVLYNYHVASIEKPE